MKKLNLAFVLMISVMIFGITSCGILQQAIEPQDEKQKTFDVKDFDRLEMGNAFQIKVVKGTVFKVSASRDSRNIDDLLVVERNGKLKISFRNNWRIRRYSMNINIEMPTLKEVNFSGATTSTIKGFDDLTELRIDLSGASKSVFMTNAKTYDINLSSASILNAFSTDIEEASLDL